MLAGIAPLKARSGHGQPQIDGRAFLHGPTIFFTRSDRLYHVFKGDV